MRLGYSVHIIYSNQNPLADHQRDMQHTCFHNLHSDLALRLYPMFLSNGDTSKHCRTWNNSRFGWGCGRIAAR